MYSDSEEISIKGKSRTLPSVTVLDRRVVLTGRWIKTASVKDEELYEGKGVENPEQFINKVKESGIKADILTFAQSLEEGAPLYGYHWEWDNAAVIPTTSYLEWWNNRLSQDTRRNVRRAAKMGIVVRPVEFDDTLVRGISAIYNETPFRQGRAFWHYGKDLETIKKENSTYLDRSEFIGAFLGEELVGFIKMVRVNKSANIMQILSLNSHADKRPTNALVAKAVEMCEQKGLLRLVYCKYFYGRNTQSPLTEFKRRNGFEKVVYPRYYVPLNLRGQAAIHLRLHHGLSGIVPEAVMTKLRRLRATFFDLIRRRNSAQVATSHAVASQ